MTEQTDNAAKPLTVMPTIGGILSIVSGGISLLVVIIPLIFDYSNTPSFGAYFHSGFGFRTILLITSALSILGGVFAIKRLKWFFSLIGVAASIVSFTGLLGIIATILVVISKKEFR